MARCVNHFVCGEVTTGRGRGDTCVGCTAMVACAAIRPAPAGPCHICMAEHSADRALFPMCNRHAACVHCVRTVLFGAYRGDMSALDLIKLIQSDSDKLWHRQRCPFCRQADQRSPATRYRDMRSRGHGTQGNALRDWVVAGLEMQISAGQSKGV